MDLNAGIVDEHGIGSEEIKKVLRTFVTTFNASIPLYLIPGSTKLHTGKCSHIRGRGQCEEEVVVSWSLMFST
jgi:hypothetical protein